MCVFSPGKVPVRLPTADRADALAQGRVALLGDSAHAMQPNLGQGGCMAIEDGYLLATDLAAAQQDAQGRGRALDVERVLQGYQVGLHCGLVTAT